MKKINKNKYLLLFIVSWLVTRLKLTFEFSRLAWAQMKGNDEVRVRIKQPRFLQRSEWCWDNNRFSLIKYEEKSEKIIVRRFSFISKN